MKKIWKKILATCCAIVMLVTLPGMYILADELQEDIFIDGICEAAEVPDDIADIDQVEAPIVSDPLPNTPDQQNESIQFPDQDTVDDSNENVDISEYYESDEHFSDYAEEFVGAVSRPASTPQITYDGQIVDSITYRGVTTNAVYTPYRSGLDTDWTYGCFVLVKNFYSSVYGITVSNLVSTDAIPKASSGYFYETRSPRVGDIVRYNTTTHWALVKSISGSTITLIQMNAWWTNYTCAQVGCTVDASDTSVSFFTYSGYLPNSDTNINNCTITLSPTSYTYNGSAKSPSVTVKNGSTTLSSGTDYTVSYSNNVNAGTATATVTGKGNYTGSATRTFTINKAAATLSFAEGSITKTDLNTTFTNTLTRTTDGTVRFSSSNTAVAIVNAISGQVTTVGVGTTTITVTATEGNNYKAASASYTLVVGYKVGSNVLATFDKDTGAVEFYSNGGELWSDWVNSIGIERSLITSIKVKSGTVYLPADSRGGYFDSHNNYYHMFCHLINLTSFDLKGFDTSRVTNMHELFYGCYSLTNLDLSGFNTTNVTDMSGMFDNCGNLTSLDLRSFNTSNVTNMRMMFNNCYSLKNLDLSSFNTSKVTDMCQMFFCVGLENLDLSNFNTSKVTNMNGMFSNSKSLQNLDLRNFDTKNVTDMKYMFYYCLNLSSIKLSSFDTSKVTDMERMFGDCESLNNLDLSGFNTSNVTSMTCMFENCENLTSLDLSSFNTANVPSMGSMFRNCSSLASLNLSSFNTSNVESMHSMFYGCSSLTDLDLSSFNTSNVKYMKTMFKGCSSLTNLDLSSFDTSTMKPYKEANGDDGYTIVSAMENAFLGCDNLQILKTPKKHIESGVALPHTMYDNADRAYTELPVLSNSIVLTKNRSIQSYNLTLSPTSYTYDGNAKKPSVTVKKGTTTLTKNTDYTVAYSKNINAGTAKVTVTGKGNYTGTITKTFTIAKATPTLKFASSSLSKKTGDAAFTNALTKTTDGTVTFKSSDTSVATVNSTSGKVTIKGVGTVAITATAEEGTNYKSGNVSYTLTVTAPSPAGFSDVQDPSHPYYKAIYWAAEAGITKGYSDGTFGIDRACTRSEAVMFLWRMAGKPAPVDALSSPFKDVPKSHAHYKAILWAAQKGITKGYSDGTFGINKTCTRGQIMTFIWRFKGQPAPKAAAKSPFSDVPKNHAYYKAILWGAQNKITNGFSDGTFGINKNCTRGQIVTFLYRAK